MSTDSGTAQKFNPIQSGGGEERGTKRPPSFSFVNSTNVGISSQHFLTFISNNFAILVY